MTGMACIPGGGVEGTNGTVEVEVGEGDARDIEGSTVPLPAKMDVCDGLYAVVERVGERFDRWSMTPLASEEDETLPPRMVEKSGERREKRSQTQRSDQRREEWSRIINSLLLLSRGWRCWSSLLPS